jgi:hypothetical protein
MKDLCRRIGISEATFCHWKAKHGGLEVSETQRLRQLEGWRLSTLTTMCTGVPGAVFCPFARTAVKKVPKTKPRTIPKATLCRVIASPQQTSSDH